MIAFRIQLNGEEPVIVGLSGEHVVSVIVDWWEAREKHRRPSGPPAGGRLSAGGLRSSGDGPGTHVSWLRRSVVSGDEITITVVDVGPSEIPLPIETRAATGSTESSERERLACLVEKYGPPAGT